MFYLDRKKIIFAIVKSLISSVFHVCYSKITMAVNIKVHFFLNGQGFVQFNTSVSHYKYIN